MARISHRGLTDTLFARIARSLVVISVAALINGCGYGFQGSGSILPPDVKKVYIPMADNLSPEVALSFIVTEAMRDRFDRFGALTVVDQQQEADAILKMVILSVKRDTAATASETNAQLKQNANITFGGELKKATGEILWRSTGFTITRPFGSTSGVVVTSSADFAGSGPSSSDLASLGNREISRGQEKQTFEDIAVDAAKRVYDEAVSPDF